MGSSRTWFEMVLAGPRLWMSSWESFLALESREHILLRKLNSGGWGRLPGCEREWLNDVGHEGQIRVSIWRMLDAKKRISMGREVCVHHTLRSRGDKQGNGWEKKPWRQDLKDRWDKAAVTGGKESLVCKWAQENGGGSSLGLLCFLAFLPFWSSELGEGKGHKELPVYVCGEGGGINWRMGTKYLPSTQVS